MARATPSIAVAGAESMAVGGDRLLPHRTAVPRADNHCWLVLSGRPVPAMLAEPRVIDFRDDPALPTCHLLADGASADYVWTCLVDAMQEFDGKPAGLDALAWR